MAVPDYIEAGTLTDGEAWVAIEVSEPSGADVAFTPGTGTQNWSQYQDLVIIAYLQIVGSASGGYGEFKINFNNDTTANMYRNQNMYSYASTTSASPYLAARGHLGYVSSATASPGANTFSMAIINIFDINAAKEKVVTCQCAADYAGGSSISGWTGLNTITYGRSGGQDPITEIDLANSAGTGWSSGSRFDLFGVLPRMVS